MHLLPPAKGQDMNKRAFLRMIFLVALLFCFCLSTCKPTLEPSPQFPVPTAPVAPAAPANVRVVTQSGDNLLEWDVVSGATSYNVYFSSDGSTYGSAASGLSSSQYLLPTYGYYEVSAVNSAGEGSRSAVVHHEPSMSVAATPTFSPVAGDYNAAQDITISTTTPLATIYYTTDGTTPSVATSLHDAALIHVAIGETVTIKAIAVADGFSNSDEATGVFHAAGWEVVGSAGFSGGTVFDVSLALDGSGAPCVAYMDSSTSPSYKATVRHFNGSSWVPLGGIGISPDIATGTSIAIDEGGNIYLTFADYSSGIDGKATTMVYNGTSWTNLGSPGFSAGTFLYSSLAVHSSGSVYTPYVAYKDGGNGDKATVKSFNGSSWITVGTEGFSDGQALGTSLAVSGDGTPYIAYKDGSVSNKATVKAFTGGAWSTVPLAGEGISSGAVDYLVLAAAPGGPPNILYIAYKDATVAGKATVKKYESGAWTSIPAAGDGLSSGVADYVSLAITPGGVPYIAYSDDSNGGKATVKNYVAGSWYTVGGEGFTSGAVEYISLKIDPSGTPYIAFKDMSSGGMVTVMSFR